MRSMVRAGYLVALALGLPLLLASACGSDDKTKRAMDPSDGGASHGGETGDAGSAGSPPEPSGTSGAGGDTPDPGGAGSGGASAGSGGAPSAAGGAGDSGAGAGGSPSNVFVSACAYPGGDCDELTGTSDEASTFQLQCLQNERNVLDECPRTNVAGLCTSSNGGPTVRNFFYAPLDPDELEEAEQHCLELPGEWTVP